MYTVRSASLVQQAKDNCSSNILGGVCSEMKNNSNNCKAVMQGDGNVVVYNGNSPIWASQTGGKGSAPYKLVMQDDGNLVAYGANGAIWASHTGGKGTGPYRAVMQDDCNFVVYDSTKAIWATK